MRGPATPVEPAQDAEGSRPQTAAKGASPEPPPVSRGLAAVRKSAREQAAVVDSARRHAAVGDELRAVGGSALDEALKGVEEHEAVLRSLRRHTEMLESASPLHDLMESMRRQEEQWARMTGDLLTESASVRAFRDSVDAILARPEDLLLKNWANAIGQQQRSWFDSTSWTSHFTDAAWWNRLTADPMQAFRRMEEEQRSFLASSFYDTSYEALQAQLSKTFADLAIFERPVTRQVREALAEYHAEQPGWAVVATEAAVRPAAPVLDAVADLVDDALTAADLQGAVVAETHLVLAEEASAAPAAGRTEEDALAALVITIWRRVLERYQSLPEGVKQLLLAFVASVVSGLVVNFVTYRLTQGDQQRMLESMERRERLAAHHDADMHRVVGALRASTGREHPDLIAVTDRPLRANPDGDARRIGTLAAGTRVVVQMREGRWCFVTEVRTGPAASEAREGWVYLRDLKPVSP